MSRILKFQTSVDQGYGQIQSIDSNETFVLMKKGDKYWIIIGIDIYF